MELSPLAYALLTSIFVSGAAFGAVKAGLNGARTKIDEVHKRLHEHIADESNADAHTHERIARVETKIDMIAERMR